MKLTVILCLAAFAFDGLEAGHSGCQKAGASMQTSYIGKLHEMNSHGHEECVGTFSGSTTFEQPCECCWSSFAEKCKEFLGGLVNILSTSASCHPCGKGCTSIDLDMKSRITKPSTHPHCEIHSSAVPVYKQVVYHPQEHCGGDCDSHHRHHHHHTVYKPVVYQTKESCGDECEQPCQQIVQPAIVQQPIQPAIVQPTIVQQPVQPTIVQQPVYTPVVEQVQVVPVKEICDDCDEKKHKHHRHHKHHHKHHHHKHHHKESCDDDCD